jgi:GTP cyclohydrolase I
MVVIEAEHGCMKLRGVKEPCAATVTSAVRGVFKDDPEARQEFMTLRSRIS